MYTQLLLPIHQFLGCPTPDSWIDEARKPENLSALLIDHCHCEWKAAATAGKLLRKYAVASQDVVVNTLKPYEFFLFRFGKWSIAEFQQWFFPSTLAEAADSDVKAAQQALGLLSKYAADNEQAVAVVNWGLQYCQQWLAPDVIASEAAASSLGVYAHKALQPRDGFLPAEDLIAKLWRLIKEELHHFEQVLEIMAQRQLTYHHVSAGRYAKSLMGHVTTHEPQTLVDTLIVGALIEARSCERFAKLAPYLDDELGHFYVSLLRSEARHYQDYLQLAQSVAGADIRERVAALAAAEAALILSPDGEFRFHSGCPVAAGISH
ncbi:tRNA isopentenyl-2-thiomethyl-A-37 hydroxylase MiaE [Shewanella sp. YIC-542]|uniref:tRNA isopentenyl-2-thiomethyl-A-37 hydroxylase MiaE n=1 Tax=Shewanella mytili TaxID=3377111 RepID=UPI00398E856A